VNAEDFRNERLFILHLTLGDEIHPNIGKIIHYSDLRLSTGFARAALTVCQLIVTTVISMAATAAAMNTIGLMVMPPQPAIHYFGRLIYCSTFLLVSIIPYRRLLPTQSLCINFS
jgi:hypothetical protein